MTRIVSQHPAVSVLIVNYASGPHLSNGVRALAGQSLSNIEIIVVDNCSRDDLFANARAAVAEDKRFSFLEAGTNLGFAAGNNFAAARARGAWFALLNPDAVPAPDWLEQLLAGTRRHPDVVMFGSTQIDGVDPERLDGAGDHYLAIGFPWRGGHGWSVKSLPREREVFAPCAAACLLRADEFRAANGFDERFFCYVEDIDLAFRLRLEGHRCIQVPDAVVRHVGAVSSRGKGSDFAHRCGTRNLIWCFVKCMPGPLFWPLLPLHILTVLLLLVWIGRPAWAGIKEALYGMPAIWLSRLALQRTRRVTSWRIARALSWNALARLRGAP